MHEFPIAENLMKTADEYAKKNNAASVTEISVEIGELSGIVDECLQMYHSLLKEEFPLLKNSILKTSTAEVIYECSKCGAKYNPRKTDFKCPKCSASTGKVLQGYDFKINSIKIIEKDGTV